MKPKRVDPISGVVNLLNALASGEPFIGGKHIQSNVGDIKVSTSFPKDTNLWETGIKRPAIEGKWVIVEQYPNEEKANEGHKKWVELMTESPNAFLKDIDLWSLEQYRPKRKER